MTSDLLGSNQQFDRNQTRSVGTKCVGTKQLRLNFIFVILHNFQDEQAFQLLEIMNHANIYIYNKHVDRWIDVYKLNSLGISILLQVNQTFVKGHKLSSCRDKQDTLSHKAHYQLFIFICGKTECLSGNTSLYMEQHGLTSYWDTY